jgi:hypothetical protein
MKAAAAAAAASSGGGSSPDGQDAGDRDDESHPESRSSKKERELVN